MYKELMAITTRCQFLNELEERGVYSKEYLNKPHNEEDVVQIAKDVIFISHSIERQLALDYIDNPSREIREACERQRVNIGLCNAFLGLYNTLLLNSQK